MLLQHESVTLTDKKNSIKEVVQELILCSLSRAGFFRKAAFYGGTALRIVYGLDRFSEDLDFSLIHPDPDFRLDAYLPAIEKDLLSYGFHFQADIRTKVIDSDIQSAFVKGNTREHIMICYADDRLSRSIVGSELIKIKFEVDTTPPPYAGFDQQYRLLPIPYGISLYDLPSLFAGKIHAVLCRAWKNRIKGRDLYDYVFFLSRQSPFNLKHLNARLVDSGFEGARLDLSLQEIKDLLALRFSSIDYSQAKSDVMPFIRNPDVLDIWNADFFRSITEQLKTAP